eukprot:1188907-Prorocentrum_minimum.AAC.1
MSATANTFTRGLTKHAQLLGNAKRLISARKHATRLTGTRRRHTCIRVEHGQQLRLNCIERPFPKSAPWFGGQHQRTGISDHLRSPVTYRAASGTASSEIEDTLDCGALGRLQLVRYLSYALLFLKVEQVT